MGNILSKLHSAFLTAYAYNQQFFLLGNFSNYFR